MTPGLFNYDSIVNEVGKQNQNGFEAFQRNTATLYVFTPKILPTQVLRPYQLNFGNALVNELSHYRTMQEALSPKSRGSKDAINKAVLPRADGLIVNCNDVNTKYTFILIIDNNPYERMHIRNCAPSPGNRLVGIGYFSEEPIAPFTNTPNPNAVLIFTHFTSVFYTQNMGMLGTQNIMSCAHDVDVVSADTANMYNNPMFLGTPHDIITTVDMTATGECIGNIGDIMVTNKPGNAPNPMISNIIKSPRHFLGSIAESLDTAVNEVEESRNNLFRSAIMPSPGINELDTAMGYFSENVQGSSTNMPTNGFNMNRACTMSELTFHYPNLCIAPFHVPEYSTWGVTPQDSMSMRNVASSMIASALPGFAAGSGLTNIAFFYDSWVREDNFSTKKCGFWNIMNVGTIHPCSDVARKHSIDLFKHQMETSLFPILISLNGEFTLCAVYNSGGEILIDLLFNDDRQGLKPGEAYYETNSRLGGTANPLLMDYSGIMSNSGQMHELVDTMLGKKLGPEIFHNAGADQFVTTAVDTGQAIDYGDIIHNNAANMNSNMQPAGTVMQSPPPVQPDFNYSNVI